jgi:hypothetical protein
MDDTSNLLPTLEHGNNTAAAKLKQALSSFLESLDAVTIPVAEGRKIPDGSGAIALSEKADDLYREILPFSLNSNGYQKVDTTTKGVSVKFAPIGRNGFDAEACAAFQRISLIVGFPAERWNRLQATNPGGNHHRYESCDVISSEDIELVKSALRLLENQQPAQEEGKKQPWDDANLNYLSVSEAISQMADGGITLKALGKKLKPDGQMRYMRKGHRAKIHIGDFRQWWKNKNKKDANVERIMEVLAQRRENERKHR